MTLSIPTTLAAGPRALALLSVALSFAACGGGPAAKDGGVVSLASPTPVPTGSAAPAESVDPEVAMEAFTQCMREHGVDVFVSVAGGDDTGGTVGRGPVTSEHTANGDPQTGPRNIDPKAMQEADEACRSLLPSGTLGDPTATMDPALADQLLAFAKCMRDHGIDMPDRKFDGGGVSMSIGGPDSGANIDPGSDEFKAAQDACGSELPGGGPGFIGGPATESKP
jgi:hypothetical protein